MPRNKKRSFSIKLSQFKKKEKLASAAQAIFRKHYKKSDDSITSNDLKLSNNSILYNSECINANDNEDNVLKNDIFDDDFYKKEHVYHRDDGNTQACFRKTENNKNNNHKNEIQSQNTMKDENLTLGIGKKATIDKHNIDNRKKIRDL